MSTLICLWWGIGENTSFCKIFRDGAFIIPLIAIAISFLCICWSFRVRQIRLPPGSAQNSTPSSHNPHSEDVAPVPTHTEHCAPTISTSCQVLEAGLLTANLVLEIGPEARGELSGRLLLPLYLVTLLGARYAYPQLRAILRSNSEALYCAQGIYIAAIPPNHLGTQPGAQWSYYLIRLAIGAALLLIHWTAPRLPSSKENTHEVGRDETASLLSRLSFSWMDGLLWKAFRAGSLEEPALYALNQHLASAVVTSNFRARTISKTSLLRRMFHYLKMDILRQGAWAAVNSVFVFVPAMLIKLILEYLEAPDRDSSQTAWLYVFGLLGASILAGVSACQCGWAGQKIGSKVRAILLDQIYVKILRRRLAESSNGRDGAVNADMTKTSDGAIFNFVSGDVQFISQMSGSLYLVWVTFPVQIVIGTCLLYAILGMSGVLGLLVMVAALPLHVQLSRRLATAQGKVLTASDARIHASNELLNAIRTVKYYAWERPFEDRVLEKRRAEMRLMRSRFLWWSISMTVFHSMPLIITTITLFFYTVVFKEHLLTSIAFPALATFSVVRIPLDRMTDSIKYLIQAHVSLTRINQFLDEDEVVKQPNPSTSRHSLIGFAHASFTWSSVDRSSGDEGHEQTPLLVNETTTPTFTLKDINIEFHKDGLNVVCGPSGSGKSSLLLALMGEMNTQGGVVSLPHDYDDAEMSHFAMSTAYCPHDPWIVNQSIRANILLGLPFDAPRYETVLRAVALDTDIAALKNGDQSQAGENGSRLSGGQKQRVSLARALYSKSRYVLLDDCLSALDARTARHVFFNAIKGTLMEKRTCILATHHTQLAIPHCDYAVKLESGRVVAQGSAKKMTSEGILGTRIPREHEEALEFENVESSQDTSPPTAMAAEDEVEDDADRKRQSESEEGKAEGAVPWPVIRNYLKAMGPAIFWVFVATGFAGQQLVALATNLWIRNWASQYDRLERVSYKGHYTEVPAWYYLGIYTAICVAYALVTFLRDLLTFSGSLKASSKIYKRLLHSILFAKLQFFERPLGQITNRLSKDISTIDSSLASFSVSAFQLAVNVAMVVLLMLWILPGRIFLLAFLASIFTAYYFLTTIYIRGAQDLKRLEAVARSPLFQQVGETITGYVSIRAYRREALFTAAHGRLVDALNRPMLLLQASEQWLTLRVDILSSLITFATGVFVMLGRDVIEPGAAGLILTYVVTFTENMLWLVQIYAIIQQSLTSVERIAEYTDIAQEPAGAAPGRRETALPEDWPAQGGVAFRNFTTRYAAHLNPVLHGISFAAEAGERVAIVGRTGAGKSSLALALLRVLEGDRDDGRIELDGVDIATVPLARLRGGRAVTVIPQDPQLFEGTVDANLDPTQEHTGADKIAVLRSLQQAAKQVESKIEPEGLDLAQEASKLSRGQRQLLCVARGLLRKSRVLVLDEATASVDHVGDEAIQAGLRAQAKENGTTVITIAHRLLTIADYDRVVVLEAGRVIEQGTVGELLGREGGKTAFRRLCEGSGDLDAICRAAGVSPTGGPVSR